MGAVTTLTVVALIADVGRDHVAVATSCEFASLAGPPFLSHEAQADAFRLILVSYVSRTIGQVLGVALSGALTQSILQKELSKRITGENAEAVSCKLPYLLPDRCYRSLLQFENRRPQSDTSLQSSKQQRSYRINMPYTLFSW
jgi:hypothetical protein